jgi:antitoxin PrlF
MPTAFGAFLEFLAQDISVHPECLRTADAVLEQRIQALTAGVTVDLDAALSVDNE